MMTRQMTGGSTTIDVAVDLADTWANHRLTRVRLWLVFKAPRGPVTGCHVALHYWFVGFNIKYGLVAPGVEPMTSRQGNGL
jgi:hypothetical protein